MTASVAALLDSALEHLGEGRAQSAVSLATAALAKDRRSVAALRVLALANEAAGNLPEALANYGSALQITPDDPEILKGLARLALDMGMPQVAGKLMAQAFAGQSADTEAACLLARALAQQDKVDSALDVLTSHLGAHPEASAAWNQLGQLVSDRGDLESAQTFFAEAIRLDPGLPQARFNAANLLVTCGEARQALEALEAIRDARLTPRERAKLAFTRACAHLLLGELRQGWTDYAARNDRAFPGSADYEAPGLRWTTDDPLDGLKFLLVGEQGLGDEVMFASLVPDLLDRLGPDGALSLAVEPRLVRLMQRSFPGVEVLPHATIETGGRRVRRLSAEAGAVPAFDAWAPMADLLPVFRSEMDAFPDKGSYLRADPLRMGAWKAALKAVAPGPTVGLLWKSGLLSGSRANAFAAFEAWAPVLASPGITFVNLQYGDCSAEISWASQALGVSIWTPPGIDLKQDLDDVTALACALDLVVGVSNATFNLAAAAGAPAWLVSAPDAWPTLGSDRYPWYPQVRLYPCRRFGGWSPVLESMGADLRARFPS